jgi:pyrimidine operon attenuation protein/uracil phosphoribosyltransferase|tara:strand:+ start:2538 stop:3038 length:501 start_codon:yes stop_codon:yes gene_type:complete
MKERTELLSHSQILQKIDRIAFQIIEDNLNEKEVYIIGIANTGFVFAQYLIQYLEKNSTNSFYLIELKINKRNSVECLSSKTKLEIPKGKVAILVDDVLNTGETLMHASHIILRHEVSKMRTVVLIDRRHRLFPIKADYAGLTLSTTLENHIEVVYENNEFSAFLD